MSDTHKAVFFVARAGGTGGWRGLGDAGEQREQVHDKVRAAEQGSTD